MDPQKLIDILSWYGISLQTETVQLLSGGKDNITFSAYLDDKKKVIVQYMQSIRDELHAECIEKAVDFTIRMDPSIGFVWKLENKKRFYPAEKGYIQLMNACSGRTITELDIDDNLIRKLAERLGKFHKATENFHITPYKTVNYHRDRLTEFRMLAEKYVHKSGRFDLINLLSEYTKRIEPLHPVSWLRVWLIHGDPVFKNFLIDSGKNIVAWIDYDMMSVTTRLWDLADMYRGYSKMPDFGPEQSKLLLAAYEKYNPLTIDEKNALPDYIRMMTLDTGYRYILALDEESGFYNAIGDSLEKAKRCIRDYDRVGDLMIF